MLDLLLNLTDVSLFAVFLAFTWSSSRIFFTKIAGSRASDLIYQVWTVTKWPALVFVLIGPVLTVVLDEGITAWGVINFAFFAATWWACRKVGDDDTTRKRRRKFSVKIQELQGRLVAVPA